MNINLFESLIKTGVKWVGKHLNYKIKLPKKVKLVTKVDVQYDKYVLAIR